MMAQTNTNSAYPTLPAILKSTPELYDLHTHLLGMGNAGFWVDTILMDQKLMPTHTDFINDETIRTTFCPLIWDTEKDTGFVDGTEAARFFYYLYQNNILPVEEDNIIPSGEDNILSVEENNTVPSGVDNTKSDKEKLSSVIDDLTKKEKFSPVLCKLINEELNKELLHQGLCFKDNFSYDVVLTQSDLADGLGIKKMKGIGFKQLAITEKLMGYLSPDHKLLDNYICFDAREQKFDIKYGIPVEKLRQLITVDPDQPSEAKRLARAHIINAFSMCDAQGTTARLIDFHTFHGSFTPEFYPRRFALKDSIYSQRLDVLAALIEHIAGRYQTSLPPVTYCEFSVGVSDLSSPWVFDVLRSFGTCLWTEITQIDKEDLTKHIIIASDEISSFSQIVANNHFPHLQNIFTKPETNNANNNNPCKPRFTYKFLAGFGRQKVASPLSKDTNEALRLLYNSPQRAIHIMMKEITKSKKEIEIAKIKEEIESAKSKKAIEIAKIKLAEIRNITSEHSHTTAEKTSGPFDNFINQLEKLKLKDEKMPSFYEWVVGLDLFGDELGYPYCPFVAYPFIEYILHRRSEKALDKRNERFGLRIHCGENVIFANDDSPTYRLFIAHMYIVFRCLRFLQCELKSGIRIGHGIAFDRILGAEKSPSQYRKSSVLLAEMREHANYLFKNIAFEVNITSNEYLLGQTLRQGGFGKILCLDALFELNAKIILATDDDGIWPIDRCLFTHPGHHSLSAEYCRAISTSLIKTPKQLKDILTATKEFCFSDQGGILQKITDEKNLLPDDIRINSIIIHPNIIKLIKKEYKKNGITPSTYSMLPKFKIYDEKNSISNTDISWTDGNCSVRVAFICACFNYDDKDEQKYQEIRVEYGSLFPEPVQGLMTVEDEFNFIYNNWVEIRSTFVFPKKNEENKKKKKKRKKKGTPPKIAPYIELIHTNQQQGDYVVYSEPEPQNVTQGKQLHDIFIEFLQTFRNRKVEIRAFAQEMNIEKTVEAINTHVNGENNADMYKDVIVTIYTNPNKNKYMYKTIHHRFKLQVNPKPMKRDYNNQNFLYVLCPHASAATAAVHLISEQLSIKSIDQPETPLVADVPNHTTTTEPSNQNLGDKKKNGNESPQQELDEHNSQKQGRKRAHSEGKGEGPEEKRELTSDISKQ